MDAGIYLWLGIETEAERWTLANFQTVITFLKTHRFTGAYVKVFDGLTGEWYSWLPNGFASVYALFKFNGLDCIPYGFHYGNDVGSSVAGEAALAIQYLNTYGVYCADMEGSWDGQGDWMAEFASIIAPLHASKHLLISTWANITQHSWLTAVSHLSPVTTAFLPQSYDDYLYDAMMDEEWGTPVLWPTFDLSQEYGQANDPVMQIKNFLYLQSPAQVSLWEWTWAKNNTALVDAIVKVIKDEQNVALLLNKYGAVCDITQNNQLADTRDSQDECGPTSVAELHYAGPPNNGGWGDALQIDALSDQWYNTYIGIDEPSNQSGSTIDNMHSFLRDAKNLHYWDIDAINANSTQASDMAIIRAVVKAGYIMLVTAREQSVISNYFIDQCPYPWQPAMGDANHIFPIVGIDKYGDYICADELNSFEPWYQTYNASRLGCSWATIVQLVGPDAAHPWHKPIPSNTPTAWPVGFNAQNWSPIVVVDNWNPYVIFMWEMGKLLFEAAGKRIPLRETGIFLTMWKPTLNKTNYLGYPTSDEEQHKDENGLDAIYQAFSNGVVKWQNGHGTRL